MTGACSFIQEGQMADNPYSDDLSPAVVTAVSPPRPGPDESPDLRLTVVQYEDDSDRGTIHPPGLTGIDRMETWLSADLSVFVDLDSWR